LRSDKADATQTRAKARTLANTESRDGRELPNTRTIIDRKENVDIYRKDETSIDWDWDSVGTTLIIHAFRNCYSTVREIWTGNASPCGQGIKATTKSDGGELASACYTYIVWPPQAALTFQTPNFSMFTLRVLVVQYGIFRFCVGGGHEKTR